MKTRSIRSFIIPFPAGMSRYHESIQPSNIQLDAGRTTASPDHGSSATAEATSQRRAGYHRRRGSPLPKQCLQPVEATPTTAEGDLPMRSNFPAPKQVHRRRSRFPPPQRTKRRLPPWKSGPSGPRCWPKNCRGFSPRPGPCDSNLVVLLDDGHGVACSMLLPRTQLHET
jgi:hypothetical protein